MTEIIEVADLRVDYKAPIKKALEQAGFILFRVNPRFLKEEDFQPKFNGLADIHGHVFNIGAGYDIKDIPGQMEDRIIRPPKDLREVIAFGSTVKASRCDYAVYAPEITGRPDGLLRITKYPDWAGPGLTVGNFDPEDEKLWELRLIGFSE